MMSSEYLTDEEYEMYWVKLEGMRGAISRDLGLTVDMRILDVGAGWGLSLIHI